MKNYTYTDFKQNVIQEYKNKNKALSMNKPYESKIKAIVEDFAKMSYPTIYKEEREKVFSFWYDAAMDAISAYQRGSVKELVSKA